MTKKGEHYCQCLLPIVESSVTFTTGLINLAIVKKSSEKVFNVQVSITFALLNFLDSSPNMTAAHQTTRDFCNTDGEL